MIDFRPFFSHKRASDFFSKPNNKVPKINGSHAFIFKTFLIRCENGILVTFLSKKILIHGKIENKFLNAMKKWEANFE